MSDVLIDIGEPLCKARTVKMIRSVPPMKDIYIIVAYYSGGYPHWKVYPDMFDTMDAAGKFAAKLPEAYVAKKIILIPGDDPLTTAP